MMGRIKRSFVWIFATLIVVLLIVWFSGGTSIYVPTGELTQTQINQSTVMLDNDLMNPRYTYVDYLSDHQQNVDYGLSSVQASLTNLNATLDDEIGQNVLIMNKDEVAIYDFVVSEEGYYHIEVDYKV